MIATLLTEPITGWRIKVIMFFPNVKYDVCMKNLYEC